MSTISLLWPDGKLTTGESWEEVEAAVRATQWVSFKSRREFRDEMRHRAHVWTGRPVKAEGTSEQFLRALADYEMFMVVEEPDPV